NCAVSRSVSGALERGVDAAYRVGFAVDRCVQRGVGDGAGRGWHADGLRAAIHVALSWRGAHHHALATIGLVGIYLTDRRRTHVARARQCWVDSALTIKLEGENERQSCQTQKRYCREALIL